MTRKRSLRLIISLVHFALVCGAVAVCKPVFGQSCGSTTDAQIVAAIYAEIKADKGLASQVLHINVVAVNQAVKFQGWADTKKDYDKIVGIGMDADCVRVVNVNSFTDAPPPPESPMRSVRGCAAGTKPCGDICIPEGDACNYAASARLLRFPLPESVAYMSRAGSCLVFTQ